MKKLVSAKLAGNILLLALGALAIFHILGLLSIVPPDIVWGDRQPRRQKIYSRLKLSRSL